MLTAVPQARTSRRRVPLRRKQSGAYSAEVVEFPDEGDEEVRVLEASDDELEAEYQEVVAVTTVARQRRAEVNRARQIFRESQSLKVARPSSTSSSRNSHVLDVGNWAIGKTMMVAWPK